METQILSLKDSFLAGSTSALTKFMQFIPTFLGAVIILAFGWALSRLLARVLENVLNRLHFEAVVSRTGISRNLQNAFGPEATVNHSLALLAKWFMRLIFIQAAANILSMPQLTIVINSITLFIPNLAIALVILTLGAWGAQVAGRVIETSIGTTGVANPKLFSLIARYAVAGFAVIAAVHQLGIATSLINILFMGLVGSVALAIGLAFGLGGRSVAHELTRDWYEQGKSARSQLKAVGGISAGRK